MGEGLRKGFDEMKLHKNYMGEMYKRASEEDDGEYGIEVINCEDDNYYDGIEDELYSLDELDDLDEEEYNDRV